MAAQPRKTSGAHRKCTPSASARLAVFAATTGTVAATASGAGLAAAQQHSPDTHTQEVSAQPEPSATAHHSFADISLAADSQVVGSSELDPSAVPQILTIPELKPMMDLADQLQKAVDYHSQRLQEDLAARAPAVVRPAEGVLTSGYGFRWGALHAGIDIANSLGTPIVAAEDGTVIDAGPASGFGQWVRIRHDDGTVTVYGHMETIDVSVGQHVTAGQRIAGMGSRGFSTGVHLHFEVHPEAGAPIDPIAWLAARGIAM